MVRKSLEEVITTRWIVPEWNSAILLVFPNDYCHEKSVVPDLETNHEGVLEEALARRAGFLTEFCLLVRVHYIGASIEIMKMYVGNLPFSTTDDELKELFGEFGEVTDVHIPEDRESGRPRGFAFVTMDSKEAMVSAIKDLDGAEFGGRNLRVNEAKPREDRGGGGGGGRGGRDNYRGGGGRDRDNGGGRDRW